MGEGRKDRTGRPARAGRKGPLYSLSPLPVHQDDVSAGRTAPRPRLPRHPGISSPRRPVLQAPYPPGRCLRGAPHPRTHACLCAFTQRTPSFALGAGDCQRGDGPGASVARGCQGARPRSSGAAWGGGACRATGPCTATRVQLQTLPSGGCCREELLFQCFTDVFYLCS